MINYRIVARAYSHIMFVEGLFMLLAAGVALIYGEKPAPFLFSAIITIVAALMVFTPLRVNEKVFGTKEGFVIITGNLLILCIFGTLPFLLSGTLSSFTDAFFETMAGFTTTAVSVFSDREVLSHGILFWRCLIQWFGGFMIIAFSLSVIPVIRNINIQLTTTEFTGLPSDRIYPQAVRTIGKLLAIYSSFTAAEAIMLVAGGMSLFDAVCISFSTMSTGGFSPYNDGLASFTSPYLMLVIMLFMVIAGSNLALVFFGLKADFRKITGNSELRGYLFLSVFFAVVLSSVLLSTGIFPVKDSFLKGSFHAISIISTTGFFNDDFSQWGAVPVLLIIILMFSGGMTGSPSGSIKTIRLLIIARNIRHEVRRLIHPQAYLPIRIDRHTIPGSVIYNLLVFFALYVLVVCAGALVMSFMGYDLLVSFSTSASLLGNIGPGTGAAGPFSDYSGFTESGKWFVSFFMFLGRLELLAVLILFSRSFYKR
ncbi:MAG: TrkH family potassium uptake protein [Bacteroidales bacterium]|jgi:trk system potassium uptake protein TrkH|nr:TrkH family potassium uptake protein [Bacteroidales bacterium]